MLHQLAPIPTRVGIKVQAQLRAIKTNRCENADRYGIRLATRTSASHYALRRSGIRLKPLHNTAVTPLERAALRLEFRLINLLGVDDYSAVQPLLQRLVAIKAASDFQPCKN